MSRLSILAIFLLLSASACFVQERGTVVATHTDSQNRFIPGYAGGDGVVQNPGVTVKDRRQVYRVETKTKFYELEGGRKAVMALGDAIEFRVEKGSAIVRLGNFRE
jgi:hypothetical protein